MPSSKKIVVLLAGAFISHGLSAMVFDNRFLPLLQRPRLTIDGSQSEFDATYIISTANKAFDQNQNNIPLPDIFGVFDQAVLARSIAATGKPNPLPSQYQGLVESIPWLRSGKIQMQGATFTWRQKIVDWLSTGFSWVFMRVNTRELFALQVSDIKPTGAVNEGDIILLDDNRLQMLQELGLIAGRDSQLGFGDIDWYLRLGRMWEYMARFRRIDAGLRIGSLMATGVRREINKPTSIPFGGNGHWGIYIAADGMFELREDWKIGALLRVNKRFAKTDCNRMPVTQEPQPFGAVVGEVRIKPGPTIIFQPYFLLENVRGGLALGLDYNLIWHQKDSWHDKRCDCSIPVNLQPVENQSEWSAEYFTINILYDFGKTQVKRQFDPVVTFQWDVPSSLFISSRVPRTNRVSIGVDFVY